MNLVTALAAQTIAANKAAAANNTVGNNTTMASENLNQNMAFIIGSKIIPKKKMENC